MFSSSQFDTGFTSTQFGDSTTPSKSRDPVGLVPLTVKQISEATQSGDDKSNFVVDGLDVTNVTLVGMVSEKAVKITDVGFVLDDGTGTIGCRRWVNDAFDTKEVEAIEDGIYVRVNGNLKSFQGIRQLVAFSVRPVTSFDEVTFHFIECIHFHMQSTKAQGGSLSQPMVVDNTNMTTPVRAGSDESKAQTTPASQLSMQFNVDGLKNNDVKILEYLQQHANNEQIKEEIREKGMHRDELARQLKIPMEKILDSIKNLEDEGLVYSTIDDYHFKIAALG
ncbi:hypothetical protein ACFE04_010981 [Oxalis oulophora]